MAHARKLSRGTQHAPGYLRISDVARLVGVSPSILRSWEILGLISPARTRSQYRLYTQADVRLLKRAQFLRRARGMNAPAIVHMLKTQGLLSKSGGRHPKASPVGPRLRRLLSRFESIHADIAAELALASSGMTRPFPRAIFLAYSNWAGLTGLGSSFPAVSPRA